MGFIVEIDAKFLVAQLNRLETDLPGALVTWLIAWIQLFEFEFWHISDCKYSATDELSQRPPTAADLVETEAKANIDNFILNKLNSF